MAATNWTVIRRNKKNHEIMIQDLKEKCTYKTAAGTAIVTGKQIGRAHV